MRDVLINLLGAAVARLIGLIALSYPLILVSAYYGPAGVGPTRFAVDPLSLLTALLMLSVAIVFLIPSLTRTFLRLPGTLRARFTGGIGAALTVTAVLFVSAWTLSRVAGREEQHLYLESLLMFYQPLGISFFVLFLAPGYYARRLAWQLAPAAADSSAMGNAPAEAPSGDA